MSLKILVVSDSHGNTVALQRIVSAEHPFDYLVHCGDGVSDLLYMQWQGNPLVLKVAGNIDRARGMDIEQRIIQEIGGYRFFITHGDRQQAHRDISGVYSEAVDEGCDIALFGHTHRQYLSEQKPRLFNAGEARGGYYGVIQVDDTIDFYHRRARG